MTLYDEFVALEKDLDDALAEGERIHNEFNQQQHRLDKMLAGIWTEPNEPFQFCTTRDNITPNEIYEAGALRLDVKETPTWKLWPAAGTLHSLLTRYHCIVHDSLIIDKRSPYYGHAVKYQAMVNELMTRGE